MEGRHELVQSSTGFFDRHPRFQETDRTNRVVNRINKRYDAIIAPNRSLLQGSRVLDIASHDGRWSFAALDSGATSVVGIEPRQELIGFARETMGMYGVPDERARFIQGDVLSVLQDTPIQVDGVLLLGFLYHLWQHVQLVNLVARTGARWVIVDTEVLSDELTVPEAGPVVQLRAEAVDDSRNQFFADNGSQAVVAYPSRAAVRFLFDAFGFDTAEFDWTALLAPGDNEGLIDYVKRRRATFVCTRRS